MAQCVQESLALSKGSEILGKTLQMMMSHNAREDIPEYTMLAAPDLACPHLSLHWRLQK
jgi:hypothetical protein